MHRSPSPVAVAVLAAAILLTTGCGYIAGPLVPLANVPLKISDLAVVQRGANLIVHATLPTHTTENVLIKIPVKLDLRVGTAGDPFNAEAWANRARPIAGAQVRDGIATYKVPASDWIGKEVVVGIGAIGSNGKASGWSNFEIVPVVAPPEVPSTPEVQDIAAGERVTWTGSGNQFRVLRKIGDDENFVTAATVTGHEWIDTTIEYGKTYTYMVQMLVDAGKGKVAESDLSATATKTPKDTFAPAVPAGLHVDATPNSVALVWEGDTEADLAGYRIYRSVGDGPWQKLADVNTVPSYSDTTVEHGKTYHYAVSAFDKVGNESDRSAPVEIVL